MGDPKFPKKTYATPRHPWQKDRIDAEKEILSKYGLKNKRELWKGMEVLKSFRSQARDLQARMRVSDANAEKQFQALIHRLVRYNILSHTATLDDVLSLSIDDILSRRLQTIVFKKNLARTPKQARQMITHGHVTLNGRRVTVPGMLVEGTLENSIIYHERSPFTDDLHPIRQVITSGPLEKEVTAEPGTEGETPGTDGAKTKTEGSRRPTQFNGQRRPRPPMGRPGYDRRPRRTPGKGEGKQ
ncbi:MAG: 30S ribosomal protein S4 [Candidatus Thermoplasmatota archaeon]|jgi:small subunit ribosomal protein S4|nr:30S ribosomal protein S4 [Candidatus Thermoplasmatota archaeon]MCL5955606.1 30S ribosomal protein S4 [Candidatus Thermoplasmatota archaeon]